MSDLYAVYGRIQIPGHIVACAPIEDAEKRLDFELQGLRQDVLRMIHQQRAIFEGLRSRSEVEDTDA